MKRLVFLLLSLALVASIAYADYTSKPELPRDKAGGKVQGFAPDGKKTVVLTVNSTIKNMTNDLGWSAYTPTACKFRLMSTATKAGDALTLPANATTEKRVNPSTPFVNFTGCTSGELLRQ